MVSHPAAVDSTTLKLGPLPTSRALWLIVLSIVVVYGNSLDCAWHYDDLYNILKNPAIQTSNMDATGFRSILTDGSPRPGSGSRPLAFLSFAINYQVNAFDVVGYHLVNVGIHLLTATILFLLTATLLRTPRLAPHYGAYAPHIALLAAVFWATHPINVTAVTYIVQRMTSMAALFYLLALYLYLHARLSPSKPLRACLFALCVLMGIAGLASKENAAMLPLSILAMEFYLIQPEGRGLPRWLLTSALTTIGLLVLYGIYELTAGGGLEGYLHRPFTLTQRLLTQPRALLFYLGLVFYPTGSRLMLLHDIPVSTSLVDPWTTLPCLLIVGALAVFSLLAHKRFPLLTFGLTFFLLNHLIESSILPLELIYEHRNYLPIVFLCPPIGVAALRLLSFFRTSRVVFPLLVISIAFLLAGNGTSTHLYNETLKTELSLWLDNSMKAPGLSVVHANLGQILLAHGEGRKAIDAMQKAATLDRFNRKDQKAMNLYNLGEAYERVHGLEARETVSAFVAAFEASPNYPKNLLKLAQYDLREGRFREAEKRILRAQQATFFPQAPPLLSQLAMVQLKMGKNQLAFRNASSALAKAPLSIPARVILAEVHRQRGQLLKAILLWEKVLALQPDHRTGLLALIQLYHQTGQPELTRGVAARFLSTSPDVDIDAFLADGNATPHLSAWHVNVAVVSEALRTCLAFWYLGGG